MPPKKKQQQIDISTLPQCISANAIIFCKGKKQRSQKILSQIFTNYKQTFAKLSKQQILDHAKQKNIYIDPNTLTDKQKKDPKFMQSICTELTAEVIAKATKSYIDTQNIKVRIELKNQNQKPENQRAKALFEKKLDQVYFFEDFPETKDQFECLGLVNQTIKYVLIINPIISWSNAPQIPLQINQQEQQQQQPDDQQLKQFKQLQSKQQLKPEDHEYERRIQNRINMIKKFRSQVERNSIFRDCIIDYVDCEIDPYNQEKSIIQTSKGFIVKLGKLHSEYDEFLEWKKDKNEETIFQEQIKEHNENVQMIIKQKKVYKAQGQNTTQILTNFVDSLFGKSNKNIDQQDDIEDLINRFSFDKQTLPIELDSKISFERRDDKVRQFYSDNENNYKNTHAKLIEQDVRANLQYPGLNRYLMPDIPLQSAPLRKLNKSYYIQFLSSNLPYEQFQRRLSLHKFQQIIKQIDEQRHYNFNDRVYEQHHDEKSLMRELYRAMSLNQSQFLTKYNQENDQLYVVMMYKNNQRRVNVKKWEANWKVMPNYQAWLKYFKDNQINFNTQMFYNIDYEKIGHINDQVYAFSVPDGGVLINKKSMIAGNNHQFLYGIKNHHLFGLNNDTFFSENKSTKIYHYLSNQQSIQNDEKVKKFQTIIELGENMRIRLRQSGDILVQTKGNSTRMYTPDGYTIIYDEKDTKKYKILHPTGGITQSDNTYINEKGFGMKDNKIHSIPTLLRRIDQFQIIKRDDNTVTVKEKQKNKAWIKFFEGTEYLIENNIIHIQKQSMPFVKCNNGAIQVLINDLIIKGQLKSNQNQYTFCIQYMDGNKLKIKGSQVEVGEALSQIPYKVDLNKKQFNIEFDNERLQVSKQKISYFKNEVELNPIENQENFAQNQTIPNDFISPRLFIINPSNSGVEYLNQKQLQYFFSLKSNPKSNVISKTQLNDNHEIIHIVSRIVQVEDMNTKKIVQDFNINLDIFKSQKYHKKSYHNERFAVRSFIRHKPLQQNDQEQLQLIKQKHQSWLKFIKKEQNQFGYKPKGDPSIFELQNQKKIMISFRKKQIPQVDFQRLKQQAIAEWNHRQREHLTYIAQKQEQEKIRNKMKKRKKSIAEDYLPLVIKEKQKTDETQNYSPAGFYSHYFETSQGKRALSGMPEWVFRPKTAKQSKQLDPEIVSELQNTMNKLNKQSSDIQQEQNERYDTVEVNLNPIKEIIIKPSVFTQRQIDEERMAFEHEKKAYYYHEKKRKDFDVYGSQRSKKIEVKSLMRTQPISQINQKYLITEAPFDKKIKISSMKNKLTSQASSLVEMRKQGPHNTLLKTLDKRNDYNQLLQKRTMMVHADLNDKLQRDILITPVEANFGFLKEGRTYELKINVKNQDILAQRLVVKKPRQVIARVQMIEMGPIALGMSRKIVIQLKATSEYLGRYTDEFEIVSKHQIYKIPITATILTESQFQNDQITLKNDVKEVQEIFKRKTSELPPIN